VIFCRTGVRSARAAETMLRAGYGSVMNLRGGINAWASENDPTMKTY
jgi:adenylyltransferase/sulfurtransferase